MQIFFVCEVHCVELFPLLPRKGQTLNSFLISKCLDFVSLFFLFGFFFGFGHFVYSEESIFRQLLDVKVCADLLC